MTLRKVHDSTIKRALRSSNEGVRTPYNIGSIWNTLECEVDGIGKRVRQKQQINQTVKANTEKWNSKARTEKEFNSSFVSRNSQTISIDGENKEEELYVPDKNTRLIRDSQKFTSKGGIKKPNFNNTFHCSKNAKKSSGDIDIVLPPQKAKIQRSQVDRNSKIEKEINRNIQNRMKYLSVEKLREDKQLEIIKKKYEKVLSIRNETLKQKSQNKHLRSLNSKNDMSYRLQKIKENRAQKESKLLSESRLSREKVSLAQHVRHQSKEHIRSIEQQRRRDLSKNRQMVRNTQSALSSSRQAIENMRKSRISSIRSIENKKLVKNCYTIEQQQKQNTRLFNRLQRDIATINESKLRAASQLQEYESMLGLSRRNNRVQTLRPGQKNRRSQKSVLSAASSLNLANNLSALHSKSKMVSTTMNSKRSKSFYLTNI